MGGLILRRRGEEVKEITSGCGVDYFSNVERFVKLKEPKLASKIRARLRRNFVTYCAPFQNTSEQRHIPAREFSSFAGNVDLEIRGNAMNQLSGHFVLAQDFDRLGQFDAPLVDLEPLRRQPFGDIGCRNRAE